MADVNVVVEKLFSVNKGAAKKLHKAVKEKDYETQSQIVKEIASQVLKKDGGAA